MTFGCRSPPITWASAERVADSFSTHGRPVCGSNAAYARPNAPRPNSPISSSPSTVSPAVGHSTGGAASNSGWSAISRCASITLRRLPRNDPNRAQNDPASGAAPASSRRQYSS